MQQGEPISGEAAGLSVRWSGDATIRIASDAHAAMPAAASLDAKCLETRITGVYEAINAARRTGRLDGVVDCIASATVVQVTCDLRRDVELIMKAVATIARDTAAHNIAVTAARQIVIPVCYDPRVWRVGRQASAGGDTASEWARDLSDVATATGLSIDEVIARHTAATYRVLFLGFAPGFAYLAGLPTSLHVPRLASPRSIVPAGSVAIAAGQAGVYARATPGGWRLLGRTPLILFDARRGAMLRAGDVVRYERLAWEKYEEMMATGHDS